MLFKLILVNVNYKLVTTIRCLEWCRKTIVCLSSNSNSQYYINQAHVL